MGCQGVWGVAVFCFFFQSIKEKTANSWNEIEARAAAHVNDAHNIYSEKTPQKEEEDMSVSHVRVRVYF